MQINMSPICRLWIFRSFTPSSALPGRVRDHHRFLLKGYLDEWKGPGARIAKVEQEIKRHLSPFQQAVSLWQPIPGMDWITAANLVAEIGVHHRKGGIAALSQLIHSFVSPWLKLLPPLRGYETQREQNFPVALNQISPKLRATSAGSSR